MIAHMILSNVTETHGEIDVIKLQDALWPDDCLTMASLSRSSVHEISSVVHSPGTKELGVTFVLLPVERVSLPSLPT